MNAPKTTNKLLPPSLQDADPYDVLGVPATASDAEITKAYRKLALRYHPDKASDQDKAFAEHRFHQIKEARAFLLEAEHQAGRREYDVQRASALRRQQVNAQREASMSAKRKQMRDELERREKEANQQHKQKQSSSRPATQDDWKKKQDLRKEGKRKREEMSQREMEKEVQREQQQQMSASEALENRQVRLKWDRKKIKISPSEDSLAQLLARFGPVQAVELMGAKGNLALATFVNPESCRPCVDFYADSKEMRAKFVGARKHAEAAASTAAEDEEVVDEPVTSSKYDGESLQDRQLRQAAEREALLREMEEDDSPSAKSKKRKKAGFASSFQREFPDIPELKGVTSSLEKLGYFERQILGKILPAEDLESMLVSARRD